MKGGSRFSLLAYLFEGRRLLALTTMHRPRQICEVGEESTAHCYGWGLGAWVLDSVRCEPEVDRQSTVDLRVG